MKKIKAIPSQILVALAILLLYADEGSAQSTIAGKMEIIDEASFNHYEENVNGISLHYVKGGKGQPVLLLHGYPQTWYEWRKVMPALSKQYTVIAIDLRGSGSSAKPNSGYDTKTMATDIYELTRKLKLEKIVLLGHDIGGMVVFAYAHLYPETLKGIGIFENPIPGFQPIWQAANDNPKTWWFKFHATPEIPEILVTGREKEYVKFFINYVTFNKAAFTEKDFDVYAESMKDAKNLTGGFNYYR
jgi:pimeloyl-ACP methyl ester carboxylesterase